MTTDGPGHNPFDFNKQIRDAIEKGYREGFPVPPAEKPRTASFSLEQGEDNSWGAIFKKAFKDGLEGKKPEAERDWSIADLEAPPAGSPLAPAELPGETRASIAQMYSQFQEFQRVGFSRDEAWELIKVAWATSVATMARYQIQKMQEDD